nr:hypothetical protein [uncultured Rhodoferax sp.]
MTPLQPHWNAIASVWRTRNNRGRINSLWVIAALLAVVGGVVGALSHKWQLGGALTGIAWLVCMGLLIVGDCVALSQSSVTGLVPGHVRVLRQTLAAVWAIFGALVGLLSAWSFGHAAHGLMFFWIFIGFMALGMQSGWVGVMLMVAVWASSKLQLQYDQVLMDAYMTHTWSSLALTGAVVLFVLMRSIRRVNSSQPVNYLQRFRRQLDLQATDSGRPDLRHATAWEMGLARLQDWPQHWWLSRLIRHAKPTAPSVLARALVVLQVKTHWIRLLANTLVVSGVFYLVLIQMNASSGRDWRELLAESVMIALVALVLIPVTHVGAVQLLGLHSTRREQALLMLLPGMPQGTELNGRIARALLTQFMVTWCLCMAAVALVEWFAPAPLGYAIWVSAAFPSCLWLTRDLSALSKPSSNHMVASGLLMVLCGIAATILLPRAPMVIADHRYIAAGVLFVVPTLLALGWRWRKLQAFPPAFPVGRLA